MDTQNSERQFAEDTVELFNEKFDNLTADKSNYGDVIEMLAAAIHSEKVQKIVNDKYLEHIGYDLEEVAENGKNFLAKMVEKAKANENEGSYGE